MKMKKSKIQEIKLFSAGEVEAVVKNAPNGFSTAVVDGFSGDADKPVVLQYMESWPEKPNPPKSQPVRYVVDRGVFDLFRESVRKAA